MTWSIRPAQAGDAQAWTALRNALWPDERLTTDDLGDYFGGRADAAAFIAVDAAGTVIGFAEADLRHDYVNGTESSPVGFLEGWYVMPGWRRSGVGAALVAAVEQWTRAQGCSELASDTWIDNDLGRTAHAACGFEETERVVYFRKRLER